MKKQKNLSKNINELAAKYFFDYIRTKAIAFLEKGPEEYRKKDFLGMPLEDWSEEIIDKLHIGCKQIKEYNGLTLDTALTNLEIDGFYRLMDLFHYKFVKQSIHRSEKEYFIDKMEMKHQITGMTLVLFNTVKR